jgi:hypothetical protein
MKLRVMLIGFLLAAVIIALPFLLTKATCAEDQSASALNEIKGKLDQVLSGQRAIANDIASMKQEIDIIKIRVTQSQ